MPRVRLTGNRDRLVTKMPTTTETAHIWLDERGAAWVDDTNTKVIEIIRDKLGYGLGPEEIHEEHPHLSLAQIHAAFAYYYDHQQALDADMERRHREAEAIRSEVKQDAQKQSLTVASVK